MKELTVDRCLKQILRLKKCISEGYVSINERDYLQALEIALPILEQQERGDDGWIEWRGGECPAHPNLIVETKWDDGDIIIQPAGKSDWMHDSVVNIIAYRIIPERANKATLTDEKREWLIDECKADMQRYTSNSPRYLVAQIALASLEACYIIPEQPTNQSGEQ